MPRSSVRKKKNHSVVAPKAKGHRNQVQLYIEDFLAETVSALENTEYCLVSVLEGDPATVIDDSKKHYYVLSRDKNGKLLEHNEGPAFSSAFEKILTRNKSEKTPVKVMVGYFASDQVTVVGEGIAFATPHLALQWKAENKTFQPEHAYCDWNGYAVQPGGEVERTF